MPLSILAIDLGGTHCRFACFNGQDVHQLELQHLIRVHSAGTTCFDDIICQAREQGLDEILETVHAVSFALAGPTSAPAIPLVNLGWSLHVEQTAKLFDRPTVFLNDFAAHAYSWLTPLRSSAQSVQKPTTITLGPVGFTGAGTGFGKALLLPDQEPPRVLPSEGGHCTLTIENRVQQDFYQWMQLKYNRPPTWDDVLSGRGLIDRYEFLYREKRSVQKVAEQFQYKPELIESFASDYGCACRQYALEVLPRGGIVLCGGITAKNPAIVRHPSFYQSFTASHAHQELLSQIPVYHMATEESALWGAAAYGMLNG